MGGNAARGEGRVVGVLFFAGEVSVADGDAVYFEVDGGKVGRALGSGVRVLLNGAVGAVAGLGKGEERGCGEEG